MNSAFSAAAATKQLDSGAGSPQPGRASAEDWTELELNVKYDRHRTRTGESVHIQSSFVSPLRYMPRSFVPGRGAAGSRKESSTKKYIRYDALVATLASKES